ncbi:unnamed protein product, partial [Choristocarpus tenellus]
RYEVELNQAKKPAIKAILQGDASESRLMVLCVSRVYKQDEVKSLKPGNGAGDGPSAAGTGLGGTIIIEVTDGWYALDACLDDALSHFVRRGRIAPGVKLAVSGAILEAWGPTVAVGAIDSSISNTTTAGVGGGGGKGVGVGVDPLDLLKKRASGELGPGMGPCLRLGVNSTRPARWDAMMGFGTWTRAGTAGSLEGMPLLGVPLCSVVPG